MSVLSNPQFRLLAGASLISFSPVFVAWVSVPATTSAFYRVTIGGCVLLAWLLVRREFRWPRPVVLALLLLAAAAFAADLWFWHKSILYIGPGLATLLANFQVFAMTAAGVFLLGQRPSVAQLLSIPLALTGLAMIVGLDWQSLSDDYRWGVIFGLLTAVSYAVYLLSFRYAQAAVRSTRSFEVPTRELAVVSLGAAVLLGIGAMAEGTSLVIPTLADGALLVAYGVLAHVLGWLLIVSSLAHVPAALVGLSLLLQPLLSFVWDVLFFGRSITALEIAGATLALVAIYIGSRQPPAAKSVG